MCTNCIFFVQFMVHGWTTMWTANSHASLLIEPVVSLHDLFKLLFPWSWKQGFAIETTAFCSLQKARNTRKQGFPNSWVIETSAQLFVLDGLEVNQHMLSPNFEAVHGGSLWFVNGYISRYTVSALSSCLANFKAKGMHKFPCDFDVTVLFLSYFIDSCNCKMQTKED